jgi:group I intron endonuclease
VCSANKKIYIGSAVNLWRRKREHFKTLRGNRHINSHLQRAWSKYGDESFCFEVIELILSPFLLEREQYWLDKTRSYEKAKGFNISKVAGSSMGVVFSGERKDRISRALSHSIPGFISPNGESVTIHHMRSFCQEHGLKVGSMYALHLGKQVQHQGWRHENALNKRHIWIGFIDPQGNEVPPIQSLRSFCLKQDIPIHRMYRLANGKDKDYLGWTFRQSEVSP